VFGALGIIDVTYHLGLDAGRLARIWAEGLGTDKATADAIIAASAIATSADLVTLNTRQFSRLREPGLKLLLIDQRAADWTDGL
jgi:predicted nucleic acid-binding protein